MRAFETHYYKINRIVLMILGLWPYQQSYLVRIQNVVFIFILTTFIMVQLLVLVTAQYNFNLLLSVLAYTFPNIFVTMKYCLFVIQADSVKRFLDEIQDDWSSIKDKLEIYILKKYASNLKFITVLMISLCQFFVIVAMIFQCLPLILDVVSPLNISRPRQLLAITEYFVNQEQYFYALLLHEFLTGYIGELALCSTGTTLLIYVHHSCALLKITSHRIEYAFEKSELTTRSPGRNCLLYRRIVYAVTMHRKATEFVENLTSEFVTMFLILILIGVSCLSLSLFQFLLLLTSMDNISELLISFLFIISNLCYMFIGNYCGQEITNHGIQLFRTIYNVPWYAAPLQIQKLLLFMMKKGTKDVTLTCAGILDASLEGFASMASTAVSYFMVIYSTR